MLDEGEGAGDEVQQWALLQEDALGPRRHSRRRIPCAPRFQGGDVVELDSGILIVAEEATLGIFFPTLTTMSDPRKAPKK